MIMSMTGFGSYSFIMPVKNSMITVMLSLKSVNSRYFEVICKLPYAISNFETEFTKLLKRKLIRGTVTLNIHFSSLGELKGTVVPSLNLTQSYLDALNQIQKTFNVPGTITINDLITLPGIFETSEELLDEQTAKKLVDGLEKAIDILLKDREREGIAMGKDLQERVQLLAQSIQAIEPRATVVFEERKKQLMEHIDQLVGVNNETKEHQLIMLNSQLDKLDIHEEIIRFKTHLENLKKTLAQEEQEKGKKIDFILQELLREINTLMAKCADATISAHAITIKVELEKAREQAQNIV